MAKESVSVSPSPVSATQSLISSVGYQLEELRNRSAKKRRWVTNKRDNHIHMFMAVYIMLIGTGPSATQITTFILCL